MKSWSNATFNELCRFERDNIEVGGGWSIMTDTYNVWLSKQQVGEWPTDKIEVPRAVFNRMVKQYLKPRKLVRKG